MKKTIWTILAAPLLLASCTFEQEIVPRETDGGRTVVFSESVAGYADTRAADGHPIENIPAQDSKHNALIPAGRSFGVYAWKQNGATTPAAFSALNNTAVGRTAAVTPVYTYTPSAQWPEAVGDKLSFLAYYPHSSAAELSSGMLTVTNALNSSQRPTLKLDYTVPANGDKHIDLMVAAKAPVEPTDDGTVGLTFRHALARVQFSARIADTWNDGVEVTVTGITLKNAARRGTLTLSADNDTDDASVPLPNWTGHTQPGDIRVADEHILSAAVLGDAIQPVTLRHPGGETTKDTEAGDLIVLPQPSMKGLVLAVTAKVVDTGDNSTKTMEYTVPLDASPLLTANGVYDYRLTLTPEEASLETWVLEWDNQNGSYIFDGQHYLKVGQMDDFNAWFKAADNGRITQTITVETDHPDGWQLDPATLPTWVDVTPQSDGITVALLETNHGPADWRETTFDIVAGNLHKTMTVRQRPGGILASPGVIGLGMESGQLTLQGSREYENTSVNTEELGPLAGETVYATYFKWGSLVGLGSWNSRRESTDFASGDIVFGPEDYVETLRNTIGTATGQTAWAQVPFQSQTLLPQPDNGLGDPCAYYFGGTWMLPTGNPWHSEGGSPFGTQTVLTGWTTTANGSAWIQDYTFPTFGAVAGDGSTGKDWSIYLPAAGSRDPATGTLEKALTGDYWSVEPFAGSDSYLLEFSEDGSLNTRKNVASGFGVRCVQGTATPYLELDVDRDTLEFNGRVPRSLPIAATSYLLVRGTDKVPAPWTAEFSTDGGTTWTANRPDWIDTLTLASPGSMAAEEHRVNPAPFPGVVSQDEIRALKAATPVTDYNLAGTPETTANSYIVNGPGVYRFPVVYGNALKEGKDNTQAYRPNVTGNNVLSAFVRHDDQPITAPWIADNGLTVEDAVLVWQDTTDLTTGIQLLNDGGKQYVRFEVKENTIWQGNALIAVRDPAGTILWSWHIWVTPLVDALKPAYDLTVNYDGMTNKFMQHNVGTQRLVLKYGLPDPNNHNEHELPRSVKVRIVQTGSELTKEFTIRENPDIRRKYSNTYYQWGRKDPLPPGMVGQEEERDLDAGLQPNGIDTYDYSYIITSDTQLEKPTLGEVIRYPWFYYDFNAYNRSDWTRAMKLNFWDATNSLSSDAVFSDNEVVKTVYDPSPRGFKLPPINAFTGFGVGGLSSSWGEGSTTEGNTPNSSEEWFENYFGREFYLDPTHSDPGDPVVFYPGTGGRTHGNTVPQSGELVGVSNNVWNGVSIGYLYSASPMMGFSFYKKDIQGKNNLVETKNGSSGGRSIRPIADE